MKRGRGTVAGAAALVVLALQVVVVGNQWVNEQVYRHVSSQSLLLLYSAAAQSTWRIPGGGDGGYAMVADLRAVLLLVLAFFLVALVSRGPRSLGSAFVSCWGAIIIAAASAGAVYGIAGRHLLAAHGIGLFTSVVQTMSAGAGYGVLGAWVAALVAALVGRRDAAAPPSSAAEPPAQQAAVPAAEDTVPPSWDEERTAD